MRFFKNQFRTMLAVLAMMISCESSELLAFVSADQPMTGISSTGNIISIWSVYDNANASYVIRTSTWDSINGWSSNATISTIPSQSFNPLLAVNGTGNAAVIWTTLDTNNLPTLQGRIYYNGAWDSGPTQFSATDESIISYKLKLNDSGEISVIWSSYPPSSSDSAVYALTGSTVAGGWNTASGITKISD
ncbi:MAG: hypothetical protein WC222_08845 [Parachlamydiales bacterium]|jgi:hypothetical protein